MDGAAAATVRIHQVPEEMPSKSGFCTDWGHVEQKSRSKAMMKGAPEQFSHELSEIDAFFCNKVKSQLSSVPTNIVSERATQYTT